VVLPVFRCAVTGYVFLAGCA